MVKTADIAIERAREFLRRLKQEYDGVVIKPKLGSAEAIHKALCDVKLPASNKGKISQNMIVTSLRMHGEATGSRESWRSLLAAIASFKLHPDSKLFGLQDEIRGFADNRDDERNDTFVNLFSKDKSAPNFDTRLIGTFVVYRQVTDSASVEKALLTIQPVAGSTGMRFLFVRADDKNMYRYAEGRVLKLANSYMLVGSLFNPAGEQSDGGLMVSISKLTDDTPAQINQKRIEFSVGLHSICADYIAPCCTRMLLVRLRDDESTHLQEYDVFKDVNALHEMVDIFNHEDDFRNRITFEAALDEVEERTEHKISRPVLISALSNETKAEDTLYCITNLT